MNCEKLSATLTGGEAYLIYSDVNRRYFTGFPASDALLLVTRRERILFADSRYIEAACAGAKDCTEVVLLQSLSEQLPPLFEKLGIHRAYIEDDRLTVAELRRTENILPSVEIISDNTLTNRINALRSVKNREEIALIRQAQAIAEKAFDFILGFIREGVSEREIALKLDGSMLSSGAEAVSFETIAVSGENSSMPHGVPGERKIKRGDFITLDYGAVVNGYHSDMTRTLAVGEVSEKQALVYETVLRAQQAAAEAIKPGALCRDVDKAARDIITAAGFGKNFGHSTGHGVGVEIHELPSVSPKNTGTVLEPGNIITDEPGIYLPGEFGVRIENMYAVTENGAENLTDCPSGLIVLN